MKLSELPPMQSIGALCRSQVKTDLSFSLSVSDAQKNASSDTTQSNSQDCTHEWRASSCRSVSRWCLILGLAILGGITLRILCRLLGRLR